MGKEEADFINTCYPISQMKVYKNGCYKLVRKSLLQDTYLPEGSNKIVTFTKKSLANLIFTINATDIEFHSMITLTYPKEYPANGAAVKEDLRVFTQWLQRRFDTEVLWFLEFQERGAPHFHILTQKDCLTPEMRIDAGMSWVRRIIQAPWFLACFRFYQNGSVQGFDYQDYRTEVLKIAKVNTHDTFWELAKSENGMRNYAAKYASKMYQKEVPKKYTEVGRFWGSSKGVKPREIATIDTCEEEIRKMLETSEHTAQNWDILPKLLFNVTIA